MSLQQLSEKATAEGMSLLDYLAVVRSTLMRRFLAAAECADNANTAMLGGRITEVLRLVAQVSGELSRATSTISNNVLILQSPLMSDLQQMLMTRLRPHPDALRSVVQGLEELSSRALQGANNPKTAVPMLEAPRV